MAVKDSMEDPVATVVRGGDALSDVSVLTHGVTADADPVSRVRRVAKAQAAVAAQGLCHNLAGRQL